MQDRERPEKVRGHSRLVGDRFNKQGSLYMTPVLGGCKISRSPHLSIKILMFRYNLNTVQSSILSRWSEQPYSLEIIHLEQLPLGDWWQNMHSNHRGGDKEPLLSEYSLEVNRSWTQHNTGGSDGRVSACNVGDSGLIPGWGRSPGEGNGNPL